MAGHGTLRVCGSAVVCVGSKSVSLLSHDFYMPLRLERTVKSPHDSLSKRGYYVIHAKHYSLLLHDSGDC